MSLKRRDVKVWLDPEDHAELKEICDLDGVEMCEFIEHLLVPAIRSRCDGAIALSERLRKRGISQDAADTTGN